MTNIVPFAPHTWEDEPVEAIPLPSMQRYRPIARIQQTVALSYGIAPEHMKSVCRWRAVAWPRQVAMYLTREITGHSLCSIGHHFGERDHTTVIHAIRAVEQRMSDDALYLADVEALRAALS